MTDEYMDVEPPYIVIQYRNGTPFYSSAGLDLKTSIKLLSAAIVLMIDDDETDQEQKKMKDMMFG